MVTQRVCCNNDGRIMLVRLCAAERRPVCLDLEWVGLEELVGIS